MEKKGICTNLNVTHTRKKKYIHKDVTKKEKNSSKMKSLLALISFFSYSSRLAHSRFNYLCIFSYLM